MNNSVVASYPATKGDSSMMTSPVRCRRKNNHPYGYALMVSGTELKYKKNYNNIEYSGIYILVVDRYLL